MRSKRKSINHSRVSMYMASIAALGSVVVGSVVEVILSPIRTQHRQRAHMLPCDDLYSYCMYIHICLYDESHQTYVCVMSHIYLSRAKNMRAAHMLYNVCE